MKNLKIILLIVMIMELGWFFYAETNDVVVNTQEIKDVQLKEALADLRIVQISDLHISKKGFRERRLITLINNINPDIIFITGDFISRNKGLEPCLSTLKEIVQERTVVAVLGNSDHSYKGRSVDTKRLIDGLRGLGIKVLINNSVKLTVNDRKSSVYIVGLDDNYLWFDDIFKATNNIHGNRPEILLAHAPNIIEKINTEGINLILSGHTHGGQIVLPFIGAIYTNPLCNARKKYVSGLYNEDTKLYVSRGIGNVSVPLRLFCQPEITIFRFI